MTIAPALPLAALDHAISGPPGEPLDWDRMRALFVPGARRIPTRYRPDSIPRVEQYGGSPANPIPAQYLSTPAADRRP